jgi:hypothetical protein
VSGICCASACDSAPGCKLATGATCADGEHCAYPDNAADGSACDDANPCTPTDECQAGSCAGSGTIDCSAMSDQCNSGVCDPTTGSCVAEPFREGDACSDGDACTVGETCSSGACGGGSARSCDDGVVCTDDRCDAADGCHHDPNTASCDDGNPCTVGDHCGSGLCQDSSPKDCTGQNDQCNVGTCNAQSGACGKTPVQDGTGCSDGSVCTTGDKCQSGACTPVGTLDCADSNACTTDSCDATAGCIHDGTGVTTANCLPQDACESYHCRGDQAGHCDAVPRVDCSGLNDQCHAGTCDPVQGCVAAPANQGGACSDNNACTTGETCNSGACTGGSPTSCDDSNPCTTDSCNTSLGCTNQDNTLACDDGDACTVGDACSGGLCHGGTPKTCAGNACNDGTCNPSNGSCGLAPKADGTSCNDSNSCTSTDTCQNGSCSGSGNACGPNATGCTPGNPNTCTCQPNYVSSGGQCVPNVDECAGGCGTAACDVNATCSDPSATCGNRTCTCKPGYTGNGLTCTNINECAGNPCGDGRGTCAENAPGAGYACNCSSGYKSVDGSNDGQANPSCVCDLNGTFAIQVTTTESWTGIGNIENASQVVSHAWSIRVQSYDASGKLVVSTEPCGGTAPDLCGTGVQGFLAPEAYAQFSSNSIWGGANMPIWTFKDPPGFTIANALPGQPYVEPQTAALLGISLTDPFGAWPASRQNVLGGTGTRTNGAAWIDADSDGKSAVTNYIVPPGGVLSANAPFPPEDYHATSSACPRSSAGTRLPYAYVPAQEGLSIRRVKRFSNAARVISQLSGTISATSCDTITGNVIGPQNGKEQIDGRVADCVIVNGAGESACSATVVNGLDGPPGGTHTFDSVTFIIERVASDITCDEARTRSY